MKITVAMLVGLMYKRAEVNRGVSVYPWPGENIRFELVALTEEGLDCRSLQGYSVLVPWTHAEKVLTAGLDIDLSRQIKERRAEACRKTGKPKPNRTLS